MPPSRRARGDAGEALAEAHLRRLGWRILARNIHVRTAEIDLLALDRRTLCFVEVRLRTGTAFGSPEESFDARKRRRLRDAARRVLAARTLPPFANVRFDLIAIDASRRPPELRHHRGVIED